MITMIMMIIIMIMLVVMVVLTMMIIIMMSMIMMMVVMIKLYACVDCTVIYWNPFHPFFFAISYLISQFLQAYLSKQGFPSIQLQLSVFVTLITFTSSSSLLCEDDCLLELFCLINCSCLSYFYINVCINIIIYAWIKYIYDYNLNKPNHMYFKNRIWFIYTYVYK